MKSEVYQFRDKCFSTLKKISLDIRYAENFWLLEERLKKVDTIQKAQSYGSEEKHSKLRSLFGGKLDDQYDEIQDKFSMVEDEEFHETFRDIISIIDQILDEAEYEEQFLSLQPGCIQESVRIINSLVENRDVTEGNLNVFFQMLRVEVEKNIQDHEISLYENEDEN